MSYQISVEKFGKIKEAEVKVSPFTLFVGDNNSGKSYLLTLIWGLKVDSLVRILTKNIDTIERKYFSEVYEKIKTFVAESKDCEIVFYSNEFEDLINQLMLKNRKAFVQKLFNSDSMQIGKLSIKILEQNKITLRKMLDSEIGTRYSIQYKKRRYRFAVGAKVRLVERLIGQLIRKILVEQGAVEKNRNIYFPASRTGFLLAKDSINRVGRDNTFSLYTEEEEEEKMEPFTMPILHFINSLDVNQLSDKSAQYKEICEFIEKEIVHGQIVREEGVSSRVEYIPSSQNIALSMRTSSAIVTELTPLILILNNSTKMVQCCYEEPEMCLHPELQLKMARILIQLVNKKVNVIATTHSDIILQHVNNMCRLAEIEKSHELMERYGLTKDDCIRLKDVSVYQFTNEGEYSTVKELEPDEGGFHIPTFSNALLNILKQTTDIQEYEEQED